MAEANVSRPVVRMKIESASGESTQTPKPSVSVSAPKVAVEPKADEVAATTKKVVTSSVAPAAQSTSAPRVRIQQEQTASTSVKQPQTPAPSVDTSPSTERTARPAPSLRVDAAPEPKPTTVASTTTASVEWDDEPLPAPEPTVPSQTADAPGQDARTEPSGNSRPKRPRESLASWVHRSFPGHEHAFWGGVVALLVALLVFVIGLWRVIFISIVVIVGIAIGQVLDGDPKLVNTIRDLIDSERRQG